LTRLLAGLKNVTEIVHRRFPGPKTKATCVLSPPLYRGAVKKTIIEHDKPFRLDGFTLSQIRDQEAAEYAAQASKPYAGIPDDRPIPLEYRLLKPVSLIFDDWNQSLELVSYVSIGSEAIIKRIKDTIIGGGHFSGVDFYSRLLAVGSVISNILPGQNNFLLVDPAGEQTDLALVSDGMFAGQRSFRPGLRPLWRQADYRRWQSDWPVEDWLTAYQKQVKRLTRDRSRPAAMFVMADDDDEARRAADWLSKLDWQPEIIDEESRLEIWERLVAPGVAPPANLLL